MAEDQQPTVGEPLQGDAFRAGRAEIAEEMKRRLELAPKAAAGARHPPSFRADR
jgi:hypothetical protein